MRFWESKILGKQDFGKVGFWESEISENWENGIWENGILEKWDFGKMGFWENESLGKWDFGKKGFWEIGF